MNKTRYLSALLIALVFVLIGASYALAKTEIIITPLSEKSESKNPAIEIATELATGDIKVDTSAATSGFIISSEITKALVESNLQANDNGIIIAQQLAETDVLYQGRFVTELDLLKRLTLLARLEPWQALTGVSSRTEAVRQLERDYADAIAAGEASKEQVVVVGNNISAQVNTLEQEIETSETAFFDAFGDFQAEVAGENYEAFVEKKQQLVVLRAEFGRYKALNDRFNAVLPAAKAKQTAISKNREALIEGVQVDKDTAVRAGVVKEIPEE